MTMTVDRGVGLGAGPSEAAVLAPVEEGSVSDLVGRAAAGDRHAWDGLVDRFAGTVWAVARGHRLSAADAADVSQTTWLRLIENIDRIEQPDRVGAWLATTARRESLRVLRLAGRQVPGGDDIDPIVDPRPPKSPEHDIVVHQGAQVIESLMSQLPQRSQLLLRLLTSDSPLSYRDISESLDMPIGSIGPTRARALEHLRRLALQAGLDPAEIFT